MKKLFIFDLDGTLGEKTPAYPNITPDNATCLRYLNSNNENTLFLATGRPRSQVQVGMAKGGVSKENIRDIFSGQIYEDGLFVKVRDQILYNAVDESPEMFRQVKAGFFDSQASEFFLDQGFVLFPGVIVNKASDGYQKVSYDGNLLERIEMEDGLIPLYQQGNDVRETYKTPLGFEEDYLGKLAPYFEKISKATRAHLDARFPEWQDSVELVTWPDSVEVYPRLKKDEIFLKGRD